MRFARHVPSGFEELRDNLERVLTTTAPRLDEGSHVYEADGDGTPRPGVTSLLSGSTWSGSTPATRRGREAHRAIENALVPRASIDDLEDLPGHCVLAVNAAKSAMDREGLVPLASEVRLSGVAWGGEPYSGMADLLAGRREETGLPWYRLSLVCLDWKTGEKGDARQVAAYLGALSHTLLTAVPGWLPALSGATVWTGRTGGEVRWSTPLNLVGFWRRAATTMTKRGAECLK